MMRVTRFKCIFCGSLYASEERSDECEAVCRAKESGTLSQTQEDLDHEELVAQQVPDVREVTDSDVDAAVAAGGEGVHPLECVIDFIDGVLLETNVGRRGHRHGRLAQGICRKQILLDTTEPTDAIPDAEVEEGYRRFENATSTDVDELRGLGLRPVMDAIEKALPQHNE